MRSQPKSSLVKRTELEERPRRGGVPGDQPGDPVAGPEGAGRGETQGRATSGEVVGASACLHCLYGPGGWKITGLWAEGCSQYAFYTALQCD